MNNKPDGLLVMLVENTNMIMRLEQENLNFKVKFMALRKLVDFNLFIYWRSYSLMNKILNCQLVCF